MPTPNKTPDDTLMLVVATPERRGHDRVGIAIDPRRAPHGKESDAHADR